MLTLGGETIVTFQQAVNTIRARKPRSTVQAGLWREGQQRDFTAAGGAQGAEALSGLARAFIYAQARALLVSHWEVASDATVKLVTGAISRLAADKSMGRAEAMRQSMLALIDEGTPEEAHPAFWAPFVVVGEGAAQRSP